MSREHLRQRTLERENTTGRERLEDADGSRQGEFAENVRERECGQQRKGRCNEDTIEHLSVLLSQRGHNEQGMLGVCSMSRERGETCAEVERERGREGGRGYERSE